MTPVGFPLWLIAAALDDGSTLTWDDAHGDELLYVREGELATEQGLCTTGGVVVVESSRATSVRALGPTRLLHFGARSGPRSGPSSAAGHTVHVVDASGRFAFANDDLSGARLYADSTCPTCRVTFMRSYGQPPYRSPSHSHSADEVMYLLDGHLRFGRTDVHADTAVAIPGGARYGFGALAPYEFVNFRSELSFMTRAPRDPICIETADGLGFEPVVR
jgi:hypothetical protein